MKNINLLIVEDCPFTQTGYTHVLNSNTSHRFTITFANNCDEAVKLIKTKKYTLVLLDLQLPTLTNEKYVCGEGLGLLIRKTQKGAKIIILTNITDALRVNSIINEINPEGFIIKATSDPKKLNQAIETVLEQSTYYCSTIKNYLQNTFNGITIDDFDRQILYHLSMGEKTKDLHKHIALTTRAIEERKAKLKTLLNTNNDNDFNLVKAAKSFGII